MLLNTKLFQSDSMKKTVFLYAAHLKRSRTFQLTNLLIFLAYLSVGNLAYAQTYHAPYEIPRFQDFISGCKLQAPNSGTAATQSALINGYTDNNFYVVDVDKVAFNQSGSSKRTELRHLTNWTLGSEDRSLHAKIKVVQQTCDQVTLLQIHDDANAGNGPNKPLLRIYKHQAKNPTNHIWAAIKTDAGGSNTTHIDLGLAPTDYFTCDIRLVGGDMIIEFEGVEKVNMDVSFWTFPSYWKAGVYLQDDGEATAYFDELYLGSSGLGPAREVYVSEITTGTQDAGEGNKYGKATVTILDNNGTPVANASVRGTFSGTFNETISGMTGSDGVVDLLTTNTASSEVTVELCVDSVGHASLTYNKDLNVMTCISSATHLSLHESDVSVPKIFPNPSKSVFTIHLNLNKRAPFQAKLYAIDGKILKKWDNKNLSVGLNQIEIDLATYKSGFYLLEINLNGHTTLHKILKQ